ncbi:MAG TPA: MBL fold metallo-hydrolase [Gaiellales bacterium]|jgi:L-ascorbate metabolism protein UlaG (beta-lactamase superfamily)|nr:MBL fold metallo-hydrolase [Gaiellales bacterium]
MIVRWHGQSAFTLTGAEHTVAVDPFGPFPPEVAARITFDYPPIEPHPAHLLLVTHEHRDHNAVEVISGEPHVVRSTAGRFETPVGEVIAVASEHDDQAGTARGPNTIYVLTLDGLRIAHFGDLGQAGLRPEQRAAIGDVDLVFVPVGGGPTIDASAAAAIVRELAPAYAIPMHYRTPQIGFLETADAFIAMFDDVERIAGPEWSTPAEQPPATRVVVLQPPGG